MLNRRQILASAGAAALVETISFGAQSANNGSGGRTVINAVTGFANLAKGFGFASDPTNMDANGYPIRTPTTNWLANPSMPEGYFGDFVWKFRGRGSMQFSPGAIIRSGGTNIVGVNGNFRGHGPQHHHPRQDQSAGGSGFWCHYPEYVAIAGEQRGGRATDPTDVQAWSCWLC